MEKNGSIIASIIGSDIDTGSEADIPAYEPKKVRVSFNPDLINYYVKKYGIEEINLSNLQKLHERELINVPFYQKLRKRFDPQIIKSHLMEALGISKSYTGFHEFMRGDRDDLPTIGLCNIAKTVGYDLMVLPIPEDLTPHELARLNGYRNSFIDAVEQNIKSKNVPTTKAKTKKEKPKDINNDFLGNLAKSNDEILEGITNGVGKIAEEDKISADAIFNDGEGELEIITKQFEYPATSSDGFSIGEIPNEFGSESLFNLLNDSTTSNNFMNGYEDNFEDFKDINDEEEFDFFEEKTESPINELNKVINLRPSELGNEPSFINIPK